jgi:hypothetical protein
VNRTWELINKAIVYLLVFLLPSQLALHFWPSWAFVFGIRVDYLAPTVYLTDILVFTLIFVNIKIYKEYSKYLLWLFLFALFNIYFSTLPPVSLYKWVKIFEFVGLGIYFAKSLVPTKDVIKVLIVSAVSFSLIGVCQFFLGRSIGAALYFLGERTFNTMTPGIALVNLFGQTFLRAYSTFSHPNSLAGFLGISLILFFNTRSRHFYQTAGLVIVIAGFGLTFSLAASLAISFLLIAKLFIFKTKHFEKFVFVTLFLSFVISIASPLFSKNLLIYGKQFGQSYLQRVELSFLAGKMVSEKFLTGQGLNTFVINSPRLEGIMSHTWLLQPVHNIPLLVFSETGALGMLMLFVLFFRLLKKGYLVGNTTLVIALMFVIITGSMDHYWFTLQQNMLLVSILLGLLARRMVVKH